jgi:hypothetical protein
LKKKNKKKEKRKKRFNYSKRNVLIPKNNFQLLSSNTIRHRPELIILTDVERIIIIMVRAIN